MPRRRKILRFSALVLGLVVLVCGAVVFFFPDALLQRVVEGRLTTALRESYPGASLRLSGVHYNVMANRIACDTAWLSRDDSSFTCRVTSLSVGGVRWMGLLTGREPGGACLGGSVIGADSVSVTFRPAGYAAGCGKVRLSGPDSEIVAGSVEIRPLLNDKLFFRGSRFRKTRFIIDARRCSVSGLAWSDLLRGGILHARSVRLQDVAADVMINKDKPASRDSAAPRMPGETLAALRDTLRLDSLVLTGGRLTYCERMSMERRPATLNFEEMAFLVTGLANHAGPDAGADIQASGIFAGGGTIHLSMLIPLVTRRYSFRYSGTVGGMDVRSLNSFVEISDNMRIKSGTLSSAAFDIHVNDGSATGTVHALYKNLIVASIDARTGSEKGILERFSSWIARNVTIRTANTTDRSGASKAGVVSYVRKKSDPFLGFSWFALRSGVGNIVGFLICPIAGCL